MKPVATPEYCGRFAPSPTGPLHFGSLVAALGSYLQARHHQGRWLVRIEDIDPPRAVPGAGDQILVMLEHHGLQWDGPVMRQSTRAEAYEAALERLRSSGWIYPCACSRKDILQAGEGAVYPGICRNGVTGGSRSAHALRVLTHERLISFIDGIRGPFSQVLEQELGDFVVRRADGLYAYQLAVVVDDAAQGVTEIVRGADLLDNTPRQIHLQQLLHLPTPHYCHLPLVLGSDGAKLSKQNLAQPVSAGLAPINLWDALVFLGQQPPLELRSDNVHTILDWAIDHWRIDNVPRKDKMLPPDAHS